jgi:hypothetical protein
MSSHITGAKTQRIQTEDPAALSHTTACGNSTLLPHYSLQEFDENQTEDPLVPQSAAP